ncbi:MAG TPA: hypothetical protein VF281_01060 [Candidatus Saccharimonadales bacterium]
MVVTNQDRNVTEVRETRVQDDPVVERQVVADRTVGGGVVIRRAIYYIAGIIIALLILRMILLLLAANQGAPFVDFVYNLSAVFAWPFFGIFSYQPTYGQSTLEISTLIAILVYALAAMGLGRLFTLGSRTTEV